ncbi:hypothetical protein FQR65_LT19903 [Abscondita terminalis]|nr:hypothetical protein FQR65_LT19903 [Abscondita terminalis]
MKSKDQREQLTIWRPLLDISREQICQWVQQLQIAYVNDPTNLDTQYDRAWCRHELWHILQSRYPKMQQALARTSYLMQDANEILNEVLQQDLSFCGNEEKLDLIKLKQLSLARQRQLLSTWMKGQDTYRPAFEMVQRLQDEKLTLKPRLGGEKIHLYGRIGAWPLKKAIQEAHIFPWMRHTIQILSVDNVMLGVFTPNGFWLAQSEYCEIGALNCNITFIGGGNMAQALIGGLLSRGLPATRITVSDPFEKIRLLLQEKDVHVTEDNIEAIKHADIVVFAVKPQVLGSVLKPLKGLLDDKLLISIVAGAEIKTISDLTGSERIVRVMPNTPALVQTGAHGIYANPEVSAKDRELTTQVLAATGLTLWVNSEAQIDAVTAVSGSGPAYFFYMMESMIRAGKNMGLDEKVATALTLQTALGAAQMAITSSSAPSDLRKNVTSPNGTTQAALEVFDRAQISQNIQTALAAAQKRSQELAQELSDSIK